MEEVPDVGGGGGEEGGAWVVIAGSYNLWPADNWHPELQCAGPRTLWRLLIMFPLQFVLVLIPVILALVSLLFWACCSLRSVLHNTQNIKTFIGGKTKKASKVSCRESGRRRSFVTGLREEGIEGGEEIGDTVSWVLGLVFNAHSYNLLSQVDGNRQGKTRQEERSHTSGENQI